MNYQQFISTMRIKVQQQVRPHTKVYVHTAIKNNGKERKGLTFEEMGINISPTIYLEEYYDQFREGKSLDFTVGHIMNMYQGVKFQHSWEVDSMHNFAKIKNRIAYKVINSGANAELLKETPHIRYLDLAIVFYILLEIEQRGSATMLIQDVHMKMWNVSVDNIYNVARKNTERLLPAEFKPMQSVIEEMLEIPCKKPKNIEDSMYVLTNEARNYGAACILYEDMLERIGEQLNENYYILPSSVHEVIIVPESKSPTKLELEDVVREINETQVEVEEVLSNYAYYYSIKGKRLLY